MKIQAMIFLAIATVVTMCDGAKILGLFTTHGKSHLMIHMSIARALADKGHDVTVVTTLPLNDRNPKYRHIQLDVPGFPKEFIKSTMEGQTNFIQRMNLLTYYTMERMNSSLYKPEMQKLMNEESFDLVILGFFLNKFQVGVAAHFKCPYVISFMIRPMKLINGIIGNPTDPLLVPHSLLGESQPMGFMARVKNVLVSMVDRIATFLIDWREQNYYNHAFPPDKYPSFHDQLKNVSLILFNHHFTNGPIAPNVPAAVEIGGIQIKPKSDPLPEDIKQFLDDAKHGVIYFSLGSNARSADLKPEAIKAAYTVLASLKQRVIWKWEEDTTPGSASNILFRKWLPQDDILAHPNVKVFITHGGHGSVVESEYHGVPMVGMPIFGDQHSNMANVERSGYGLTMGKEDVTAEKFEAVVREVLENPAYRNKVQEFSRLYRDRPMSAQDTAVYWIEYVIRHRGAKHMQSPAVHMNFVAYYGLDVLGFILAIMYVVFKSVAFVLRQIRCLLCGKKKKTAEHVSQKKNQ